MTDSFPHVSDNPHVDQPVASAGVPIVKAQRAIIFLHGRGASAESILGFAEELTLPGAALLAPQAAGHAWYPHSFLAPLPANQPWLDSALAQVESVVAELLTTLSSERVALLGFSQGACLAMEYAARHPRRYGALIGLTGGLIGPPGTPRNYAGSLAGTPVFLGSGDPDPHVPFKRVEETRDVLTRMGAHVELRRYPGMAHTINADELSAVQILIDKMPR